MCCKISAESFTIYSCKIRRKSESVDDFEMLLGFFISSLHLLAFLEIAFLANLRYSSVYTRRLHTSSSSRDIQQPSSVWIVFSSIINRHIHYHCKLCGLPVLKICNFVIWKFPLRTLCLGHVAVGQNYSWCRQVIHKHVKKNVTQNQWQHYLNQRCDWLTKQVNCLVFFELT